MHSQNCDSLFTNFDKRDDSGELTISERRELLTKLGNICPQYKVGVLQRIGNYYQKCGQYDSSLIYYKIALKTADPTKDPSYWLSILNNVANTYSLLRQYDKALKLYDLKFINHIDKTKNASLLASFYYNRSIALNQLSKKDEAIRDLENCLDYAMEDTLNIDIPYYLLAKANLIEDEEKWQYSLYLYQLAERNAKENFKKDVEAEALCGKARCYKNIGKLDSCKLSCFLANEIALKSKDLSIQDIIFQSTSEIFASIGENLLAYRMLNNSQKIRDSLLRLKNDNSFQNNERLLLKELSIGELKLAREKIKTQRILLLSITLIIIVSILLIVFYLINLRQKLNFRKISDELTGQERERQRIADELHDNLGGVLALVNINFQAVTEDIQKLENRNKELYNNATIMLGHAMQEVRRISHDLDSGIIQRVGFKGALEQLTKDYELGLLKIQLHISKCPEKIKPEIGIEIYRILQELLHNTRKHANASEIHIQIIEIAPGKLRFSYEDDGLGFNLKSLESNFGNGFSNIKRRISKLNGTMSIDSSKGNGMSFFAEIDFSQTKD